MNKHAINFINFINEETNGEYTVLGDYVNSSTKLKMKHEKCGLIYDVRPNDFKSGCRCPECANIGRRTKRRKTTFSEDVKSLVGDEYIFLEDYVNYHTKLKVKHKNCEEVYEVSPANFLKGKRCPSCSIVKRSRKRAKTTEEVRKEIYDLVGNDYIIIGEYRNYVTPITIKHNKCGHEYFVTAGNFISHGKRCPKCKFSRGEKRVRDYLESHQYKFDEQYRFSDCKLSLPLPFDFVIFNEEGNITHAIEYDGEFHFHKKFRSNQQFELQKVRDEKKNVYCREKKIKLIRIHYKHFESIEKILDAKLP
ncbi:hypothetical protein [Bacillus cereus]|uniref:hypothetical protein n=1 Tax=Bacillus cereus TaxID=1396 RepID=UPI000BF9369A|nr:hypothetical protein [Bacillus cereus]PFR16515.1 hypothetical protein COK23_25465 [Bacillus cereus]